MCLYSTRHTDLTPTQHAMDRQRGRQIAWAEIVAAVAHRQCRWPSRDVLLVRGTNGVRVVVDHGGHVVTAYRGLR